MAAENIAEYIELVRAGETTVDRVWYGRCWGLALATLGSDTLQCLYDTDPAGLSYSQWLISKRGGLIAAGADLTAVNRLTVLEFVAQLRKPESANGVDHTSGGRKPSNQTRKVLRMIDAGKDNDEISEASCKSADAVRRIRCDYEAGRFDLS